MRIEDILAALPSLTKPELDKLRGRLNGALQSSSLPSAEEIAQPPTGDEAILANAARNAMAAMGMGSPPFIQFKGIRKDASALQWIRKGGITDRTAQNYLLEIGFGLLLEDMSRGGIPTMPSVVMNLSYRIPALLDREFPGYARIGMLGMIVKFKPLEKANVRKK